jgi:AhpD family alkylhydroperoxidase
MKMKEHFRKRIYSIETFSAALEDGLDHARELRGAARGGRVNRAFAERIMLAVTAVNECRYCSYGHTRAALASGLSPGEIQSILAGDFGAAPPDELLALTFAQHYAERAGQPDEAAWDRLVEAYGPETAQDVMAYIRMITMGNLAGNTLDAFLNRLRLQPTAPGSTLFQEAGVILGAPVILGAVLLKRSARRLLSPVSRRTSPASKTKGLHDAQR